MKKNRYNFLLIIIIGILIFLYSCNTSYNYSKIFTQREIVDNTLNKVTTISLGKVTNIQRHKDDFVSYDDEENKFYIYDLKTQKTIIEGDPTYYRIFVSPTMDLITIDKRIMKDWYYENSRAFYNKKGELLIDFDTKYYQYYGEPSYIGDYIYTSNSYIFNKDKMIINDFVDHGFSISLIKDEIILINARDSYMGSYANYMYNYKGELIHIYNSSYSNDYFYQIEIPNDFFVLSSSKGFKAQFIFRGNESKDYDFLIYGYKIKLDYKLVDFNTNKENNLKINFIFEEFYPLKEMDSNYNNLTDEAKNYFAGFGFEVKNKTIIPIPVVMIFDENMKIIARYNDCIDIYYFNENRSLIYSPTYGWSLIDGKGNVIKKFTSADYNFESNLIYSNNRYYNIDGIEVINLNDYESFTGFVGKYSFAERKDSNDVIFKGIIDNLGNFSTIVLHEEGGRKYHFSLPSTQCGIYFLIDNNNEYNRLIKNYKSETLYSLKEDEKYNVVNTLYFSDTKSVVIVLKDEEMEIKLLYITP